MDDKVFKTEKMPTPGKISINIPEITPYVNATLYFEGGKSEGYSLQEFNIGFFQHIDYKGQPQHNESGGIMNVMITQVTDPAIDNWMANSRTLRNGSVIFRQHGSKILTVLFEQAYCVNCQQSVSGSGGVTTRLVITPNNISLNGIEHDNKWTL